MQYLAYHKIKQRASGGTSSKTEAIDLVVGDILCWWSRTGIKLKAFKSISKMIKTLIEKYKNLQKTKNREGKAKEDRDKFINELQNTFWPVTIETEKMLANSANIKNREDWLYLESVRGKNRKATLGCKDKHEQKKVERKRTRIEREQRKAISSVNICPIEHDINMSSSSEEEMDLHDPDIYYPLEKKDSEKI